MIKNCVVHIRSLKQPLDHGVILKKVHKVIQFKSMIKRIYWHEYWIKKTSKKWFWKRFL